MITATQMRAARAMLGIDQRTLAELAGVSVPTIQRMEASDRIVRGNVDSLMKVVAALEALGIDNVLDACQNSCTLTPEILAALGNCEAFKAESVAHVEQVFALSPSGSNSGKPGAVARRVRASSAM